MNALKSFSSFQYKNPVSGTLKRHTAGIHRLVFNAAESTLIQCLRNKSMATIIGILILLVSSASTCPGTAAALTSASVTFYEYDMSQSEWIYRDYAWAFGQGPTVDLNKFSQRGLLLYGGFAVDTDYIRWSIYFNNIDVSTLNVYPRFYEQSLYSPDITGLVLSSPSGVHEQQCTSYIVATRSCDASGFWRSGGAGFFVFPKEGYSFTNSFEVILSCSTYTPPASGSGGTANTGIIAAYHFNVIPEPSTLFLFSMGVVILKRDFRKSIRSKK